MRNVMLLLGIGQLLLLLAWVGSWLVERRQRPAPQHLSDQPIAPPGRQRMRAFLAAVSLIIAIYAFTRAWMLS
jgi:hypothetical protein